MDSSDGEMSDKEHPEDYAGPGKKIKIIPKRKYVINPHPERGTGGLGVFFDEDAELLALRVEEDHKLSFVLSRDAAICLAQLIHLEMGKPERDFAIAYSTDVGGEPQEGEAAP